MFEASAQPSDRKSERNTIIVIAILVIASFAVNSLSRIADEAALSVPRNVLFAWIDEGSSAISTLSLLPFIGVFNRLAPTYGVSVFEWMPKYILASVVFSILHVAGMLALRWGLYPLFTPHSYSLPDLPHLVLFYEYRKDAITFAIFVLAFAMSRELEYKKLETAAETEDAQKKNRVTLKCGGRTIFLESSQILWAKAAGNYVEVYTATGGMHLARSTLAGLSNLLDETSQTFIRTHRSYLINSNSIQQIEPTGEGDARIVVSNGEVIPGSRRYRDVWMSKLMN